MQPRITVLTPVYNGLPYLRETIESILTQTYTDFEYLIIDDGSTDGSIECIRSYHDPRIRFIRNETNLGTSETMNKGIALARTPYVARMDQDDVAMPNRLQEQLALLDGRADLVIVCSWEYGIDSKSRKVRNWRGKVENYGAFLGPLVLGKCPIWHPSIMFRGKEILDTGGYDKNYQPVEDFELTMRIALHGYRAAIVPEYLVMQRHHGNRQSVTKLVHQMDMMKKVHSEMVQKFCDVQESEMLGQFLRVEEGFWKYGKTKQNLITVLRSLCVMFETIRTKQNLGKDDFDSLKNIVFKRLGCGARWGLIFSPLPSIFFYPVFFAFSPLLWPGFRKKLAIAYEFFRELRYPSRLIRSGIERRSG